MADHAALGVQSALEQNDCKRQTADQVRGAEIVERDAARAILARQLQAMEFMLVGLALVGLALYLRLRIFIGTRPGGVDTWYYLASAEAIRRQKLGSEAEALVLGGNLARILGMS